VFDVVCFVVNFADPVGVSLMHIAEISITEEASLC
jgi:hypothetical protein